MTPSRRVTAPTQEDVGKPVRVLDGDSIHFGDVGTLMDWDDADGDDYCASVRFAEYSYRSWFMPDELALLDEERAE